MSPRNGALFYKETLMKNKLFTALLTFATIPFFANQASTNTELLTHLKNVKTNLEVALTEMTSESTGMNEDAKEFYQEIKKLYNLIPDHTSSCDDAKNNLINDNILSDIDKTFDALISSPENVQFEQLMGFNVFYNFLKDDFIENHKEEIESILTKIDSILIKYDNNNGQSQDKNKSVLERETAPEKTSENSIFILPAIAAELNAGKQSQDKNIRIIQAKLTYCIFILGPMIGMNITAQKTWPILLQKVDAKIAELEIIL
jgi:hypothetical protein